MTHNRFKDLERRCGKIRKMRIAKVIFFFGFLPLLAVVYFYVTNFLFKG